MPHTPERLTDSPFPEWAIDMAPCLSDSPYVNEARQFVGTFLGAQHGTYEDFVRTFCAFNLLHRRDILDSKDDVEPVEFMQSALQSVAELGAAMLSARPDVYYPHIESSAFTDVKDETGAHYGALFSEYDDQKYYEEPVLFLRQRLERNSFPLDRFPAMSALDIGCGNGRYTLALKSLGMMSVTGLDWGEKNIADAQLRRDRRGISGVHFQQGNALDLPFKDEGFDFVFCNGVLNHTEDHVTGVNEMLRVLKPGGCGMIMMIPNPGGIHWDTQEILRVIMRDVDYRQARNVFALLGTPANRRMFFLDHVMVPIHKRYTKAECEELLADAGAVNIRWMARGADIDRVEAVFNEKPHAEELYGLGDCRYYFEKSKD